MLKEAIKYTIKYNKVTKKVTRIRRDVLLNVEHKMIKKYEKLGNKIDKLAEKVNKLEDEMFEIDYELNNKFDWEVEDIVLEG